MGLGLPMISAWAWVCADLSVVVFSWVLFKKYMRKYKKKKKKRCYEEREKIK
jgi:hypothetical protein